MYALTLHPTWAWFVIYGPKDVENRPWKNKIVDELISSCRPFAIHAGCQHTPREYDETLRRAREVDPEIVVPTFGEVVTGAIIGTAVIARLWEPQPEALQGATPWHFKEQWGWQLWDRKAVTPPVPAKGQQGFWMWEPK